MCVRACKRMSIKVCGCIDTQVYLHNVCMWHTHLRVSAHLCHTQLCSTCCGCATLPFTPPPFYQGHLTVQSQRSQAPSQQNRQHSRAHPGCRLSSIRRYKRHEIQYVLQSLILSEIKARGNCGRHPSLQSLVWPSG